MSGLSSMTVSEWLRWAQQVLQKAKIDTARLDSIVLLSDAIEQDKAWILAYPEYILQGSDIKKLHTKIMQRMHHMPLAYIRGKAEFYGREFIVNRDVLVPRPESESIVELLLQLPFDESPLTIYDVGTGSGCLAITAKLELSLATVTGIDIDKNCLKTARKNADTLGAEITFVQGDLLEPIRSMINDQHSTIILANLPYVPDKYPVNVAATHEPKLALFSGKDGLDHYRRFFAQATDLPAPPRYIITESLESQHTELINIAAHAGYEAQSCDGLAQSFSFGG